MIGFITTVCDYHLLKGVVLANFDIFEASYGQTDRHGTFMKNRFERSILDLAIPFDILVPTSSTICLTAIKYVSLQLFLKKQDPRARMRIFLGVVKISEIV